MKISKQNKWLVIRWVDLQFTNKTFFPEGCGESVSGHETITAKHFSAWRSWRAVPTKWRFIEEWLELNLSDSEKQELHEYIAKTIADE
jgi:hypothetical protein